MLVHFPTPDNLSTAVTATATVIIAIVVVIFM